MRIHRPSGTTRRPARTRRDAARPRRARTGLAPGLDRLEDRAVPSLSFFTFNSGVGLAVQWDGDEGTPDFSEFTILESGTGPYDYTIRTGGEPGLLAQTLIDSSPFISNLAFSGDDITFRDNSRLTSVDLNLNNSAGAADIALGNAPTTTYSNGLTLRTRGAITQLPATTFQSGNVNFTASGFGSPSRPLTFTSTGNVSLNVSSGAGAADAYLSHQGSAASVSSLNLGSGTAHISGQGVDLNSANIVSDATGLDVSSSLTLNGDETIGGLTGSGAVSNAGDGTLTLQGGGTFDGQIGDGTGTTGLTVDAIGETVALTGTSGYSGATTVGAGTLLVDGSLSNSAVAVNSGGRLGGIGSIAGAVDVNGGTIAPGASPGILSTGDVSFDSSSRFAVELNGTIAGAQYDQLDVTGTVSLGGATLDVATGFTPSGGETFTIIENDGIDAVSGTFDGLAEGATLSAGGATFRISYAGGDGNDVVLSVPRSSTTTVSSSADPSAFGQAVTFTATVAGDGATPTGDATLSVDGSEVETVALDGSGSAAFSAIDDLDVGNHSVTVAYAGDSTYTASSDTLDGGQDVERADTTTGLASSANPSAFGQAVTFTATVAPVAPGAGTPGGTVEFFDDATSLGTAALDGSGVATLSTSDLAVGTHPITAEYSGDARFSGGTSAALDQDVERAATSTSLSSSADPSVFGETVTFTATVAAVAPGAGTPGGTVEFFDGSTSLGSADLDGSGVATLSVSDLDVGTHPITAAYAGDGNFESGTSAVLEQDVERAASTITLDASENPSTATELVAFTATVATTGGGPTGVVEFFDGETSLGTAALDPSGIATLSTADLGVGDHPITAAYRGDARREPSESAGPLVQRVDPIGTAISASATPDRPVSGQPVTLSATVTPALGDAATGAVEFFEGDTSLGTAPVVDGVATLVLDAPEVGLHSVTAAYSGDEDHEAGTSEPTAFEVGRARVALSAEPTTADPVVGRPVRFDISAAAVAPGAGTPGGMVEVLVDGRPVDAVALDEAGRATVELTPEVAGTFPVGLRFLGDDRFLPSDEVTDASVEVARSGAIVTLGVTPEATIPGRPVTFTADVESTVPGVDTPTGLLVFLVDYQIVGEAMLENGSASLTVSDLDVGNREILAVYAGDVNHPKTDSALVDVSVASAPTTTTLALSADVARFGEPVTYSAAVTSDASVGDGPTGVVAFFDGEELLGRAPVVDGEARLGLPATGVGAGHRITARYAGDGTFAASTSAASALTVAKAEPRIALAGTRLGRWFGLRASVAPATDAGTAAPSGTLTLLFRGRPFRRVRVIDGRAAAPFSARILLHRDVTIRYSGDASFEPAVTTPAEAVGLPSRIGPIARSLRSVFGR